MYLKDYFTIFETILKSPPFWSAVAALVALSFVFKMYTNGSRSSYGSGQKVFGCMMVVVFGGLFLLLTSTSQLNNGQSLKVSFPEQGSKDSSNQLSDGFFYGIMIDAGSTGTRMHIFKFKNPPDGSNIELFDAQFSQQKPGLSSYANDLEKVSKCISSFLDNAKAYIPESQWNTTPIALKATAGLRLLPQDKADAILDKVKFVFNEYSFKTKEDSVEIMEGTKEGLFIWIAANYFLGSLNSPTQSVAVMDLGGGSTQVTFLIKLNSTYMIAPPADVVNLKVLKLEKSVYTHSYLGLGLMVGRFKVVGGEDSDLSDSAPHKSYSSVCFPKNHSATMKYQNKEFTVLGTNVTSSIFENCYAAATNYINTMIDFNLPELSNFQILAVSYYYDRALDVNLVDSDEPTHRVKVSDFYEAAKSVCERPQGRDDFLCLDLSYISSLLLEGFHFPPSMSLRVQKKINGNEISWALGAMFQYL